MRRRRCAEAARRRSSTEPTCHTRLHPRVAEALPWQGGDGRSPAAISKSDRHHFMMENCLYGPSAARRSDAGDGHPPRRHEPICHDAANQQRPGVVVNYNAHVGLRTPYRRHPENSLSGPPPRRAIAPEAVSPGPQHGNSCGIPVSLSPPNPCQQARIVVYRCSIANGTTDAGSDDPDTPGSRPRSTYR